MKLKRFNTLNEGHETNAESGVRTEDGIHDTLWSLFNYTDLYDLDIRHGDMNDIKIDVDQENELKPLIEQFSKVDKEQALLLGKIFDIVFK